jgi:cytoskeletal protein RodZ
MSSNNEIPSFEYKPEFRQEMERILVKRKRRKRFLVLFMWAGVGVFVVLGVTYLLQEKSTAVKNNEKEIQQSTVVDTIKNEAPSFKSEESKFSSEMKVEEKVNEIAVPEKEKNIEQFVVPKKKKTKIENILVNNVDAKEEEKQNLNGASNLENETPAIEIEEAKITEEVPVELDSTEEQVLQNEIEESIITLQNQTKNDTASLDSTKTITVDSVKNHGNNQWVAYLGGGGNNQIGEGTFSNGLSSSYRIGVDFIKKFNDKHSAGIGLQCKLYNGLYNYGGYDTTVVSLQNSNGSGYDKQEARVVTFNRNSYAAALSLPLYYAYSMNKFTLNVGANVDWLIANQYTQTSDSSKYGINTLFIYTEVLVDKTSSAKITKNDFAGINKFNVGSFVGIDYRISDKFSFGLSGQVLMKDFTIDSIVKVNRYSPLYSLNLSLKYHFWK